ncbi:MAG TPA: thioredoxin family protein [Nevskiaceae bacterium]|nr:thioredoxin family protein [Nevskiaceae bacterium]
MNRLLSLPLVFAAIVASAAQAPPDALKSALDRAKKAHSPVLVEFHAPWCYSCYYMAKNVQTGPEWDKVEHAMVVVGFDVDSPEGAQVKEALRVKALPSYVVLDSKGGELGRILAEQTRADFYRKIDEISARSTSLDDLRAKVRDASPASIEAGRAVLASYLARNDAAGGIAWQAQLPEPARAALENDAQAALLSKRLVFLSASQSKDVNTCLVAGQAVLDGDLGCDRYYELEKYMECADSRPAGEQKRLLSSQRASMDKLIANHVFSKSPTCADERSAVLTAADLYAKLGDKKAEQSVLGRAIKRDQKKLGGNLKKDRNLADNERVYLDRAGRTKEFDALLVKLIAAYPDDYVYNFRYGKSLLARGEAEKALPYFEKAAEKAYGQNRLAVAQQRAQALIKLGRRDEAKKVAADALAQNGPWFPDDVAKLKQIVGS